MKLLWFIDTDTYFSRNNLYNFTIDLSQEKRSEDRRHIINSSIKEMYSNSSDKNLALEKHNKKWYAKNCRVKENLLAYHRLLNTSSSKIKNTHFCVNSGECIWEGHRMWMWESDHVRTWPCENMIVYWELLLWQAPKIPYRRVIKHNFSRNLSWFPAANLSIQSSFPPK